MGVQCEDQNMIEPTKGCPSVDVSSPAQSCTLYNVTQNADGTKEVKEVELKANIDIKIPKPAAKPGMEVKLMFLNEKVAGSSCFSASGIKNNNSKHLTYFTYAQVLLPEMTERPDGKTLTPRERSSPQDGEKGEKNYGNLFISGAIFLILNIYLVIVLFAHARNVKQKKINQIIKKVQNEEMNSSRQMSLGGSSSPGSAGVMN